jgi:glycosyltransferase involved in cell wall biosynthesis
MNILIICNYFQPQIPYAESQIALALQKLNHTVTILTGNRYFPFPNYSQTVQKILGPRQQASGESLESGLQVIRRPIIFEFFARSFFGGIFEQIRRTKPNVVIVFGASTPSAIQVALFKQKYGAQFPFTFIAVDSHLPSEFNNGITLFKNIFYALFRLCFSSLLNNQLNKIVAAQEDTIQVITTIYGLTKNVQLVSHGCDTELFTFNPSARNEIRQQYSLSKTEFVIIYTGKLIPAKGIDILVKAFNKLGTKHTDISLLLVGDGPSSYLESCLELLPTSLRAKVINTGFVDYHQLPSYYSAADVAVWPLQESLAMLDAASCGVPFVANHTLGAKERIANNNALLYKKSNAEDLAATIEKLYQQPTLRKQMGERGRQLLTTSFSWEQVAQRYLKLS